MNACAFPDPVPTHRYKLQTQDVFTFIYELSEQVPGTEGTGKEAKQSLGINIAEASRPKHGRA